MDGLTKTLIRIMDWGAGIAIGLMAINVVLDVFTTYVFTKPIPGTLEVVAYYYMIAVVFLPIAGVERVNGAVSVELFYTMASPSIRRFMRISAILISLLFFGMLCYRTWLDALESLAKLEHVEGIWDVVVWPGRFFLPFSFAATCLVLISRFFYEVLYSSPMFFESESEAGVQ